VIRSNTLCPLLATEVEHGLWRFDWPRPAVKPFTFGTDDDLRKLRERQQMLCKFPFDVIPLEES